MTPSRMLRPVLVCLAGLATASCGGIENDPHRFETMAQMVADIPLDGRSAPTPLKNGRSLRPAMVSREAVANPGALRVEVMSPHALWDARDAGLRGLVEQVRPAVVEAAAPVLAPVMVRQVAARLPAIQPQRAVAVSEPVERTTLQLGAFSSPAAAQAAWGRIASADRSVSGLSPHYETIQVDGRSLTRLKVMATSDAARAVCRAADAAQLGCLRRG